MKSIIRFIKIGLGLLLPLILLNSCAAPLLVLGLAGYGTYNDGSYKEYPEEKFPEIAEAWPNQSSSDLQLKLLSAGENGDNIVYVGEANGIKLHISEIIDPANLVWESSMGRLEKGSDENVYNLIIDRPDIDIEVMVRDTTTGMVAYLVCTSAYLPLPVAFLQPGDNGIVKADVFRQQKMLQLNTPDVATPILCDCKSFRIIRVDKDGKREELENRSNGFSEQVKALVAKAVPGDIYIFNEIKVLCSGYSEPKLAKGIVYTIE